MGIFLKWKMAKQFCFSKSNFLFPCHFKGCNWPTLLSKGLYVLTWKPQTTIGPHRKVLVIKIKYQCFSNRNMFCLVFTNLIYPINQHLCKIYWILSPCQYPINHIFCIDSVFDKPNKMNMLDHTHRLRASLNWSTTPYWACHI